MDNLKKYLKEHREELDTEVPDEAILQRILIPVVRQRSGVRTRTILISLAVAASVLAVIIIATKVETKQAETVIVTNNAGSPPTEVAKNNTVLPDTGGAVLPVQTAAAETKVASTRRDSYEAAEASMAKCLENNYAGLVKLQLGVIRRTPVFMERVDYFNDFKVQLQQMDRDEALLRKDIRASGLNGVLLEQLINIYEQKLNLLKNLHMEINKINKLIKQKSLPADSLKASYLNI